MLQVYDSSTKILLHYMVAEVFFGDYASCFLEIMQPSWE